MGKIGVKLVIRHGNYLTGRDLVKVEFARFGIVLCRQVVFAPSPSLPVEYRHLGRSEDLKLSRWRIFRKREIKLSSNNEQGH